MTEPGKRKAPPSGASQIFKKKKEREFPENMPLHEGTGGRWKTPRQTQIKVLKAQRGSVEPGDTGVWVTCARGMEGKAARELQNLFDEYAEKLYGIPRTGEPEQEKNEDGKEGAEGGSQEEVTDDIESLVQKEVVSMNARTTLRDRIFAPIRLNVECLLFTKTRPPVDPVALVYRICKDAKKDSAAAAAAAAKGKEKVLVTGGTLPQAVGSYRYLNRLTPITASGRAVEKGIQEVARLVLSPWFNMAESKGGEESQADEKPPHTFAIRLSVRHNSEIKRDEVISQIAALVGAGHKVNLEHPDKVILVDIFRYTCGMSVVDGDWDGDLKKFNLSELYNIPLKFKTLQRKGGAALVEAKTDSLGNQDDGERKRSGKGPEEEKK